MDGVGEVFGQSVDDVVRRPVAALVPLVQDAVVILLVVVAAQGIPNLDLGPYHIGDEPPYAFAVPGALPSILDLFDVPGALLEYGGRDLVAGGFLAIVMLIILAFAEAGYLTALKRLHVDPRVARAEPGALPDEPTLGDARMAFVDGALARGPPLAIYRLVLAVVATVAALAASLIPGARAGIVGVLVMESLLLFAPYAIVLDGSGFLSGVRRSIRFVSDHLASTLVTLLFLFASTGAVAALVLWLRGILGFAGVILGAGVYAWAGTVLSLFVLRVFLGIEGKPEGAVARKAPAESARAIGD